MKGDLGESFDKLVDSMYIKYAGCLIEMTSTHYKWNGKEYYSLDSAKEAIDSAQDQLKASIRNLNDTV
jgi:hypothetical protein